MLVLRSPPPACWRADRAASEHLIPYSCPQPEMKKTSAQAVRQLADGLGVPGGHRFQTCATRSVRGPRGLLVRSAGALVWFPGGLLPSAAPRLCSG